MSQYSAPDVNVTAAAITPTDRVRWGPIIAGLFAALSTLAILTVLGIAVAGSAYDPGDNARNFGIGAGIWGAVSMLLAFFIGGWLAARSAALRGHDSGVLNGSMVWAVAIPLMLYMLMGGIGSLFRTTGSALATGAQAASSAAAAGANKMSEQEMRDQAQTASAKIQSTTQQVGAQVSNAVRDPNNQEKAADTTAKSAWGTLASLLLGLAAAAFGGYVGSGRRDHHHTTHTTHGVGTTHGTHGGNVS
jgi:hypothetical protein